MMTVVRVLPPPLYDHIARLRATVRTSPPPPPTAPVYEGH
jgi:hypothetical protein